MSTNRQRLGYRRIVQLLVGLVIVPTSLILAIGILLIFIDEIKANALFGLLLLAFVAIALTGIILVLVFVRREANLSELQADFVSKVSHELKTPLTSIRLFLETLERNKEDAEVQAQCVDALVKESDRLTRLIDRLLDWGRMEAGRKYYDLKPDSLEEIVEDAVAEFAPDRWPEMEFSTEIESDLPKIMADRSALVDAIVNLLSNARKYGGVPVVTLRLKRIGDKIAIEVQDDGHGVPRGEEGRIFDKFYRVDDRLSRTREGSGLGLAIVKHAVRAHNGKVTVERVHRRSLMPNGAETPPLGEGSLFRILLPLR
jgi:two-component system phosphate regulon sensor histidine kinase PhoR